MSRLSIISLTYSKHTFSHIFQVEKLFRKSVEFCSESDIWKLNVAHVLFMQEGKFKEATGFYEPIVRKNFDRF